MQECDEDDHLQLERLSGLWTVVLLTMMPSIFLDRITEAMSLIWFSVRSGATFKTIFGRWEPER